MSTDTLQKAYCANYDFCGKEVGPTRAYCHRCKQERIDELLLQRAASTASNYREDIEPIISQIDCLLKLVLLNKRDDLIKHLQTMPPLLEVVVQSQQYTTTLIPNKRKGV